MCATSRRLRVGLPTATEARPLAERLLSAALEAGFWSLRLFPYLLAYNAASRPPRVLRMVHMARNLPGCWKTWNMTETRREYDIRVTCLRRWHL